MRLRLVSALLIVLAYCALQYWWLPPDGFFTGDAGTKYLQARAVVAHGALRPWIDGPALDVDTALRWQEAFLLPVNGHLVGIFSWLLSILTAPFLAFFGLRGLYVIPALSVAIVFLAASSLGRSLGQPWGGAASGWCAVLSTPVLFYGAELWEHAPAVALSAVGSALLFRRGPAPRRDAALGGACFVVAAALRPEALVVAPAILFARAWMEGPRSVARGMLPLVMGAAFAGAVIAVVNVTIYGAIVPQQVTSNLRAGSSWWDVRGDAILSLILPSGARGLFVAALVVLAAGAFVRSPRARLWCAHAAVTTMLAAGVGAPLWRMYAGHPPWLSTPETMQLAHTWPALALLGYAIAWPAETRLERALLAMIALIFVMVLLTMPHTGGAQWSARFFLSAAPLAAALGAQLLFRRPTRTVAALAIGLSIGVQVYGLTYLRYYKRINAQITHLTASLSQPDEVIASDVFWYPQVTATLYPSRRLLFARVSSDFQEIAAAAADRDIKTLWIATAPAMRGYTPPPAFASGAGRAPFVRGRERDAGLSSLIFYEYVRPATPR
jgi:hypothetical protein